MPEFYEKQVSDDVAQFSEYLYDCDLFEPGEEVEVSEAEMMAFLKMYPSITSTEGNNIYPSIP